jgi:bifunctional lysine-specific demethylase and histidyl-hydroxylase MINA
MMFQEAQRLVGQFLFPQTLDDFLDNTLNGPFGRLEARGETPRTALLGPDPAGLLLRAIHLAPKLTFHSANPLGPPPSLEGVRDADDFARRIAEFHARNYSVRFPELRPLSPQLDRLARAFEILLHQPVTASAFWSRSGMRAPVHYDDHDLIVVQLRGSKRWYVSKKPSELFNTWQQFPSDVLDLGPAETMDVRSGDFVYLPRGTLHTVDSDTDSLHLSIGFTPLTMRECVLAALDHLSDLDQTLRRTVGGRLAFQLRGTGAESLNAAALDGVTRLLHACRTPGFVGEALQRRSSRVVETLASLPAPMPAPAIEMSTVLVQTEMAFCHLTSSAGRIYFSYPGGHLWIHIGAQESLLYMVNTPRFRVRDIPGAIADDVRLSLATRLVALGFLTPAA